MNPEVGHRYFANVNGRFAVLEIEHLSPFGGYEARNVITGQRLMIEAADLIDRIGEEKKDGGRT